MPFKFEKLEIWSLSKEMAKQVYVLIKRLPQEERFNLSSQIQRAVTSISLNIAEGSTSQTDPEQIRFLGYAHRSLMEVVACLILIRENNYIDEEFFERSYKDAEKFLAKIPAMRNSLKKNQNYYVKEDPETYGVDV